MQAPKIEGVNIPELPSVYKCSPYVNEEEKDDEQKEPRREIRKLLKKKKPIDNMPKVQPKQKEIVDEEEKKE